MLITVKMKTMNNPEKIINSRKNLICDLLLPPADWKCEEEGGCGVTGFISSIPVSGKNIFEPSVQMHNRGNGKGGGIAAVGFIPEALGVSKKVLEGDYMLHIALVDPGVKEEIERKFIKKYFKIDKSEKLQTIDDYHKIGLEVKPPDVVRYFVRVKEGVLDKFIKNNNLNSIDRRDAEDEFVYQNSYKINTEYYAALGEKKAFVLSHGRNMFILKIVGYAEKVVEYYKLEDFKAHAWIAHQRYPTRGRVWHPGGCHPFSVLNEALVHNGDFANYQSIKEYLVQRNYNLLFLTDTEEAALLLDLWGRVYKYPPEYLIEAMAPTGERDFDMLPPEKQGIYKSIQTHHVNASPDGPWFFIIAKNDVKNKQLQLIGITDTSMLRPQVFALQEGEVQVGLVCSEKQAIDATLISLAREDSRFRPIADKYWNARGGSYTDGGSFIFSLRGEDGAKKLVCTDKFGNLIETEKNKSVCDVSKKINVSGEIKKEIGLELSKYFSLNTSQGSREVFEFVKNNIIKFDCDSLRFCIEAIKDYGLKSDDYREIAINSLTLLNDMRYDTGSIKRSSVLHVIKENIGEIFSNIPEINGKNEKLNSKFRLINFSTRKEIRAPENNEKILVVDAEKFQPEGDDCDATLIVEAFKLGWKQFIIYGYRGQRFTGCGFGPETEGVRIDVYDSSGDYLASGIDGMEIYVHGNAQDQLGQIMKAGKLVVFGGVGQTFMYGAKGGTAYIMGSAAGRPLINAVGKPRVVINGTALDYLAESFMAGDPLNGGGFVILNGVEFDEKGKLAEYETPYPGSNIFSLASGGAIYVRDPHKKLVDEQLNGGEFAEITGEDWNLIYPYLDENEKLFGIRINDLLTVLGEKKTPKEVYRKIRPKKAAASAAAKNDGLNEEWVKK